MCSKNWYFCCQLILHYLVVFSSPLFALPPEFLHKLNRGFWCHGDGDLNFQLKSSSTNLRVAHKGKAETILFNILSATKNLFIQNIDIFCTSRLLGTQVCVVADSISVLDHPHFQVEENTLQLQGRCLDVRSFRCSDAPTTSCKNFKLMQLSFVLSTLILTMIFIRGNPY